MMDGKSGHGNSGVRNTADGLQLIPGQLMTPPSPELHRTLPLSDMTNTQTLVRWFGSDLKYCHPFRKWFVWDGTRWVGDNTGKVMRLAKQTIKRMVERAPAGGDDCEFEAYVKHIQRSLSVSRLRAMITLAQSEPNIPVLPHDLDTDPWLLNCLNGTLNLQTGLPGPHTRENLITKVVNVPYDPAATCPTFLAFLDRIMAGNEALIGFVQRALGYSLTGDTSEKALFICYGTGDNGKTTLIEFIRDLLGGDYAIRTPTSTLLVKSHDGTIPNDLARLRGARFVSAAETEEGKRLAEATIKDLTGRDTISARFMRAEWFDFKPTFKIWLATNHKPVIRGTDHAIWERIKLIPFSVRIPKTEQDKELPEKLREEAPGILAWAVEGCRAWVEGGLGTPREVERATADYRVEMDRVGRFIDTCCVTGDRYRIQATELYHAYRAWAEQNDEALITQKEFGTHLAEQGFHHCKRGIYWWHGIALQHETVNEENSQAKTDDCV